MTSVAVEVYSEKAIVVRNTLEHHGPILTALGGTFNDRLKGGRGWIFPKHMLTQVRNAIEKLNSGQYGNEYEATNKDTKDVVSKTEYLSLLSRVERLEALVSQLSPLVSTLVSPSPLKASKPATSATTAVKEEKDPFEEPMIEIDEPQKKKRLVPLQK